jgi:ATP/maltotriose-dependent transcriptional regulator MalT
MCLLSRREKEVLKFAAQGFSNKEIAERCFVTLATVKSHFRNILKKLEVKNRMGAVAIANTHGFLAEPTGDCRNTPVEQFGLKPF